MKQFFFIVCAFFLFSSVQAQTDDQYTIIVKKSADWCPNCGGWAWPVFEEIRNTMEDRNGIPILMHHTGGLANEVSTAITDNLGGDYQPEFFLDTEIQDVTPSNASDKVQGMIDAVDLNASLGSFMGINIINPTLSADGMLNVTLEQEFYDIGLTGKFSAGLYLIQNNIMHNQAGQGEVLQPSLLTASFTTEHFGVESELDGTELGIVSFPLSMEAPESLSLADGDTELVAIIWRWADDGHKTVFNADHYTGEITQLSNANEIEYSISDVKALFQDENLNIILDSNQSFENVNLSLVDLSGKKIMSQNIQIQEGRNNLYYPTTDLSSGLYIMNLTIGNKQITNKIFKN